MPTTRDELLEVVVKGHSLLGATQSRPRHYRHFTDRLGNRWDHFRQFGRRTLEGGREFVQCVELCISKRIVCTDIRNRLKLIHFYLQREVAKSRLFGFGQPWGVWRIGIALSNGFIEQCNLIAVETKFLGGNFQRMKLGRGIIRNLGRKCPFFGRLVGECCEKTGKISGKFLFLN